MADIFVSYARENLERVKPIVRLIEDAGYAVFWDRKIPAGMTWRQYIGEALDNAKCVIVVWSALSVKSDWVMEEADEGRRRGILIPITIEDIMPPLGFRSIQHEDFKDWGGVTDNRAAKNLLKSIGMITGERLQQEAPLSKEIDVDAPAQATPQRLVAIKREDTPETITNEVDGYELVKILGGSFMMGSPKGEAGRSDWEGPRHRVHVADFYMGRYPVTNAHYQKFLEANPKVALPKYWHDREFNQHQQPVVGIDWEEAQAYARWAGLRLPTEAEWEYACRAGTTTRFYSGDKEADLDRSGWYRRNSGVSLHPVGEKAPNDYGLYDMHGNVQEWVEDDWHWNYAGASVEGRARVDDPRDTKRVVRGGGWNVPAGLCRAAARFYCENGHRIGYLGFRLARSVATGS